MEKQDEYNLSIQRTKIMRNIAIFPLLLFGGLLFLGIPILQNTIHIEQIYQVIQTQFPDQELYSIARFIARQSIVNKIIYGGLVVTYVALLVVAFIRFRNMMNDYEAQIAAISAQLEALKQQHPLTLPNKLNTERAQKYLQKAIDANLIVVTDNGLRRVPENCNKTQLVYLLGRIYCQNKTDKLPNNELCQLFNETRLEKINYDIFCNNNGKPAHSEAIDALFDE